MNSTSTTTAVLTAQYFTCPSEEDFSSNETDPGADSYLHYHYILNGPTTISLIISGLICSSICLVAFYKTKRRPCIYYYLIAIVLWDIALLLIAGFMYSIPVLYYGQLPSMGPYVRAFPFVYAGSNTTLIGSVWIVVTLTLDRYFAVCQPLRHQAAITKTNMKRTIIAVSVLAFLYGLPTFFELEVLTCYDEMTETLQPLITQSDIRRNTGYQIAYKIVGSLLFYSAVPFVLLLVLTVQISLELRRAWRQRRRMSSAPGNSANTTGSDTDRGSTMMLVLISGKFLVSRLLPTTLDLAETIVGEDNFVQNLLASYFVDFSNFVVVLNSATNWLVYIGYGRNFRRKFFELLSVKKLKHPENEDGSLSLTQRHPLLMKTVSGGRRYSAPVRMTERVTTIQFDLEPMDSLIELHECPPGSPNNNLYKEELCMKRSTSFRGPKESDLENCDEAEHFLGP